jgi:23S rRNA (pseudouridine1915-N3)-methyltransferase
MQIAVIAVGRCRKAYIREGVEDYANRIGHYASLDQIEVAEERGSRGVESADVVRREGERILRATPKGAFRVALDLGGKATGSEGLANRMSGLGLSGTSRVAFWIGGAFGLDQEVIRAADWRLSLSAMTFPHEMARLILLEQVYRAFSIIRGESYHK